MEHADLKKMQALSPNQSIQAIIQLEQVGCKFLVRISTNPKFRLLVLPKRVFDVGLHHFQVFRVFLLDIPEEILVLGSKQNLLRTRT